MYTMKQSTELFGVVTVALSLSLLITTGPQAAAGPRAGGGYRGGSSVAASAGYRGVSASAYRGGYSAGYRGGNNGTSYAGYHGGYYGGGYKGGYYGGGYYGGYKGGYYGGYRGGYNCNNSHYYSYGGWYPWGLSFSYVYSAAPYYYYPASPAYYPATVAYSSPPSSTVVYSSPAPASAPAVHSSTGAPANDQPQPVSVADVKALAKAKLGDDVIISQVRSSRTVYHLTTAEILDLKETGVSEKVIDFMINTASH
jgi:hypothetical protein